MAYALLKTKLHIPELRPSLVPRPRLIEKLNQGLQTGSKLTLVSAPAGFGKSTVVTEWIAACGRPAAWLSLDERESDWVRFVSYLAGALQTIQAGIGESLLAILLSPEVPPAEVPPVEVVLTALLNEIAAIQGYFILVLDDYHAIDSPAVDQALTFLVEHQPQPMHLVIATREDPSLPLARLRGRGHLTELRAADLRFSPVEATEFLNQVMGLTLSVAEIAALDSRTEGWIAGLQMAALSLQGHPDTAGFIQSFTGSHHFVLDYLIEEVFNQQPPTVQAFLLCTSVLERMCSSLCEAVLLDPAVSGQTTLEYLERANLFVVPLDNERHWYRYHQLFAELLQQRLRRSGNAAAYHRRASEWYENNDLMLEAFRHAAAANDVARAEHLIESTRMPLHLPGAARTILNWLAALPQSLLDTRPALWWRQASLLLAMGQITGVEEKLKAAEEALVGAGRSDGLFDDRTRDLIGKIAIARATLATHQFEIETILVQANRALEYLAPDNVSDRSTALLTLGLGYYLQEDSAAAEKVYSEALALARASENIANTSLASVRLGQIQMFTGQLYKAAETHEQVLELVHEYSPANAVIAYMGLADINYEWNNLDAAEKYLEQSLQLAQQYDHVVDRMILTNLYLARLKLARGDVCGAERIVAQAEQTRQQKNIRIRQQDVAYCRSEILLRQGNLEAVLQLAQQHDLPLMQARALVAQGNPRAAREILEPLREQKEAKGRGQRLLEVMAVQATALYAEGEKAKALDLIGEVLMLAEPGGYVRLFLNEGRLMAELLSATAVRPILPNYVHRLLAAFEAEKREERPFPATPGSSPLVEPLSPRELEIVRLIAQGLSNQEIGHRLFLALDTIKGHNRRIFEKLQVQRRTEAIVRARELGLL